MQKPLVAILGSTASGKTDFAIKLCKKYNGEIVCADSRTVYNGMDVGTAKPSSAMQAAVPHHLLDIALPDQPLTVADFKTFTEKALEGIWQRGKLPVIVGGSGLYVDAVLYDFSFATKADADERSRLNLLTVEELQGILNAKGIALPFNDRNPRHLIRSIETYGQLGDRKKLRPNVIVVGMSTPNDDLKERIAHRTRYMMEHGLVEEVRHLMETYGWNSVLSQTIGYQEFEPYFAGKASLEDVEAAITTATNKLSKRQRTWFKRNSSIIWGEPVELEAKIDTFLTQSISS